MHIELDIPASPTEEDWTRMLMEAQNESFYAKMPDFPYFIQISLVYSGSSKLKGGEWLSLVDRKVVALKNRKLSPCRIVRISKKIVVNILVLLKIWRDLLICTPVAKMHS